MASSPLLSPGVLLLYCLCFLGTEERSAVFAVFGFVSAEGEKDDNDKFNGLHRRENGRRAIKMLHADDVVQCCKRVVPTGSFVDDTAGENAIVLVATLCMVVAQDWLITWLLHLKTRFVVFAEQKGELELNKSLGSKIDQRVAPKVITVRYTIVMSPMTYRAV